MCSYNESQCVLMFLIIYQNFNKLSNLLNMHWNRFMLVNIMYVYFVVLLESFIFVIFIYVQKSLLFFDLLYIL